MISYIHGILKAKTASFVVVEVGGIGFDIWVSSNSLSVVGSIGDEVELYTYLQVREDAFALYGFATQKEKEMFQKLITVNGVGPKVALGALSFFSVDQLANAISAQDSTLVSKIPGVGKKTASRIIVDLKESFGETDSNVQMTEGSLSNEVASVKEALLSMGFSSSEVDLAIKGADTSLDEGSLLKYALKRLGSQ